MDKKLKSINLNDAKHSLRDVKVGENVKIYDFVNAYECQIGSGSKIGTFVEIQKNVEIGENCKISSHTFICEGIHIGNGVFVGHNVSFINDLYPRAINKDGGLQTEEDWNLVETYIGDNVSIGTGSTILGGIKIGESAIIGAGSVVTKDIPGNVIAVGNPAKVIRKVN